MAGRAALEDQLRTVSNQLADSLASLGAMDSSTYLGIPLLVPMQSATMAATPVDAGTAELLERIRELEVQTQTMQQRQSPGVG